MENLVVALNAVVPFAVYMLLGMLAVRLGVANEKLLRDMNQVIFRMFFPFVIFQNVYRLDFSSGRGMGFLFFGMAASVVVIALAWIIVPRLVKDPAKDGVIIQAVFRSNAIFFAIPLCESVCGMEGAQKASILVAFIIPIYNLVSVIVMETFRGGKVRMKALLLNIITNPLIMGAAAGLLFAVSPFTMPEALAKPVSALAGLGTPLALFILGGTFHVSDVRKNLPYLLSATMAKLVVIPAVLAVIMSRIGFTKEEFFALFVLFATPVATTTFPMAQSMGGDADLAGEFVVISAFLSLVTIFIWIYILKSFGLV